MEDNTPTINAIGNYVVNVVTENGSVVNSSASVTPLPTDTSSTCYGPFYFVYPGIYTMTYQYTLADGTTSPVSTATFNVAGPIGGYLPVVPYSGGLTVDSFPKCTARVNGVDINKPAANYLVYGKVGRDANCNVTGVVGMEFNTPVYQNSSGGTFKLVQLLIQPTSGLDSTYPYSESIPTEDSPWHKLPATADSQAMAVVANMFLMWQSSTPNSIPVPLGYQSWEAIGMATCTQSCGTASNWHPITTKTGLLNDPVPSKNFIVSNASQTSAGYPTWTEVVSSGQL